MAKADYTAYEQEPLSTESIPKTESISKTMNSKKLRDALTKMQDKLDQGKLDRILNLSEDQPLKTELNAQITKLLKASIKSPKSTAIKAKMTVLTAAIQVIDPETEGTYKQRLEAFKKTTDQYSAYKDNRYQFFPDAERDYSLRGTGKTVFNSFIQIIMNFLRSSKTSKMVNDISDLIDDISGIANDPDDPDDPSKVGAILSEIHSRIDDISEIDDNRRSQSSIKKGVAEIKATKGSTMTAAPSTEEESHQSPKPKP